MVHDLPDKSLRVYQCDATNFCSAACSYCPQPSHKRARGFMCLETFSHVLRVAKNRAVSLHHFGEPMLHPRLEAMVQMATDAGVDVGFSTNGSELTQERLDALAKCGLKWMRVHTDPFGVRLAQFKLPPGLEATEHRMQANNDAPQKDLVSFSGHLDLPVAPGLSQRCSFLRDRWRVVLWDGTVALCCHDIEGASDPGLCNACNGYVFESPRDWGHYDG